MRSEKRAWLIPAAIFLALLLLYCRSADVSLLLRGYRPSETYTVYVGQDLTGCDCRVICCRKAEKNPEYMYMTNRLGGLWTVQQVSRPLEPDTGFGLFSWIARTGPDTVPDNETAAWMEMENHLLWYGNNARRHIPAFYDRLPPNTAVNIQQDGSAYVIHFVSYSSLARKTEEQTIDISQLMNDLGCFG